MRSEVKGYYLRILGISQETVRSRDLVRDIMVVDYETEDSRMGTSFHPEFVRPALVSLSRSGVLHLTYGESRTAESAGEVHCFREGEQLITSARLA